VTVTANRAGSAGRAGLADHRRAPRRRGQILERAIFDATLAELREVGYLNLSMERVAQRARTGNASLYRRWASRAELVIDAVSSIVPEREDIPDTGSVRGDLLALLRQASARQAGPAGEVMRGVIAESLGNNRVHAARARLADHRITQVLAIFRRGAERGEVRPGAVPPVVAAAAPMLVMGFFLLRGEPAADQTLVEIVDQVMLPLVQVPAPASASGSPAQGRNVNAVTSDVRQPVDSMQAGAEELADRLVRTPQPSVPPSTAAAAEAGPGNGDREPAFPRPSSQTFIPHTASNRVHPRSPGA
jgi:AcrR family transcriptional regulator